MNSAIDKCLSVHVYCTIESFSCLVVFFSLFLYVCFIFFSFLSLCSLACRTYVSWNVIVFGWFVLFELSWFLSLKVTQHRTRTHTHDEIYYERTKRIKMISRSLVLYGFFFSLWVFIIKSLIALRNGIKSAHIAQLSFKRRPISPFIYHFHCDRPHQYLYCFTSFFQIAHTTFSELR